MENNLNLCLPNVESFLTYFNEETIYLWVLRAIELDWDNVNEDRDLQDIEYPEYEVLPIENIPKEVIQEVVNKIWEYLVDVGNSDEDDTSDEREDIYLGWVQEIIKLTKPYWVIKTK